MLTLRVLMLLGIAIVQGQETNKRDIFTHTITLGNADGTCGEQSECDVYLPLANQLGNEPMWPFFRTSFGRLLLRYMVRCCQFQHELLSKPSQPSTIIPTERECGFPAPEAYIDIQKRGAWPWLAVVGRKDPNFNALCGGTLITKRHVLTAAHCLINKEVFVRVGVFSLGQDDSANSTHLEYEVTESVIHNYVPESHANDIAILVLPREVTFTDYVRPACLPFKYRDDNFAGKELVVVGHGYTSFGGEPSLVPLAAALPVADLAQCNRTYLGLPKGRQITENQLCMREEHQGSCQGDGGSPLNFFSPGVRRYYVVGIVSYGFGCGHPEYPGVYTRVGAYLDWIVANI